MRLSCQVCGYAMRLSDWFRGLLRRTPLTLRFTTFTGQQQTQRARFVCRFCEQNAEGE